MLLPRCNLKIHNDRSHIIGSIVTHQKNLAFPFIANQVHPDTTSDGEILIDRDKNGELHLLFRSLVGSTTEDIGTFKCDDLRRPTEKTAIGKPSAIIDVTEAKFNSDHTVSEIHIHVRKS